MNERMEEMFFEKRKERCKIGRVFSMEGFVESFSDVVIDIVWVQCGDFKGKKRKISRMLVEIVYYLYRKDYVYL